MVIAVGEIGDAMNENQRKELRLRKMHWQNSYTLLPEKFFQRVNPVPVAAPKLVCFNKALAKEFHIDERFYHCEYGAACFSGNIVEKGSEPIALAYAGHQFGHFVPALGDGRAILLGEIVDKRGNKYDIQLKGSGKTAFSRNGDGRATLGAVMREYMVSEAMYQLGVPTTRSLAIVTTGEPVYREKILPGAILTRIASSHIRVGTYEYFAARHDWQSVKKLADYTITRHFPDIKDKKNQYSKLLEKICHKQAQLVAQWMRVGFIHGVMNTDNMAVSGETIDYGPCAFLDSYHPQAVFSFIDRHGRYAFSQQATIAQWNLASLASCLLPIIKENESGSDEQLQEVIMEFSQIYGHEYETVFCRKLGLTTVQPGDKKLIADFLNLMHRYEVDFTVAFRNLSKVVQGSDADLLKLFSDQPAIKKWLALWVQRLKQENGSPIDHITTMNAHNPAYIPRNHRIEQAIRAAVYKEDFSAMDELIAVMQKPYEEQALYEQYMQPPEEGERITHTFCGT